MEINYQNPVWPDYFADPYVLKWQNSYYAYGTGGPSDALHPNRVFQVLHSNDLVHWNSLGGALEVEPDAKALAYWAPEAIERDGKFYLYYSSGDPKADETQRLRVAVADHPAGLFIETGSQVMPDNKFTIDAHPFHDRASDKWYLLFAQDYFDEPAGTALAAALLADDMLSISGQVTTLLRASNDWQIYERSRPLYGRIWPAWHTLEGPTLAVHEGRFYLMYSGGNWQTPSYGVGYAVASSVLGPYTEPETGPVVLRGDGRRVIGPGHNCVVLGPDNATQYVVYHAWNQERTARLMCIDRLEWIAGAPRCAGPTTDLQTLTINSVAALV